MSDTNSTSIDSKHLDGRPVKSFFVSMLTRDISLADAILDLLDNCVDGILRSGETDQSSDKPYSGFWAKISFDGKSFEIQDNCGGIPKKLRNYAFRMGRAGDRPHDADSSVGVYGIGMKRAIFKLGANCLIETQAEDGAYDVLITPDWIKDEDNWYLPFKETKKVKGENGTHVYISELDPGVYSKFVDEKESFEDEMIKMIQSQYALIINKGFSVQLNDKNVKPRPMHLYFDKNLKADSAMRPFMFTAEKDGVEVFLAVGFHMPIPSKPEADKDQFDEKKYSSREAGWSIFCNDRAVLDCDRTELTGWGEAGVPRYHTQFIAVSGMVEFKSKDPKKLPTTTTKRGVDASSVLYLQVKNKMREGMKLFTDNTNKWKGDPKRLAIFEDLPSLTMSELKKQIPNLQFNQTKNTALGGEQYKPPLPKPKKKIKNFRRISFKKSIKEIEEVSDYLFQDKDKDPNDVGEKCFDDVLKEAKK
jgi:hypothetical protein